MLKIAVIIAVTRLIRQIDLKITFVRSSNKIRTITDLITVITIKVFRKIITTIINHNRNKRNILLFINSTILYIKIKFISQTN